MPVRKTASCARGPLWLALALALLPAPARGWGFVAHKAINARAVETLPPELKPLFAANADYVAEHAIDPDLWRLDTNPQEAPNHFLDMDAFGKAPPFAEIPRSEEEHLRRHGAKAVEQGRVPWRVGEVYRQLVRAFRARDSRRALETAATLGHYVGDAHVPLHAVVNYDGKDTGQPGVHGRWEAQLVERFERQLLPRVQPGGGRPAGDPVLMTFDVLMESFVSASAVLESDRAAAGPVDLAGTPEDDRYDEGFYSRFAEREADRVVARMTRAVETLGGLWRQAWEEAGRPAMPAYRFPYVRKSTRAVLLSIDGGAAWVIEDAVRRGVMPRLAALRAAGVVGRAVSGWPPKTAVGHATLYTGAWSDRHGIVGNEVPVPGASVLEGNTGYASTHLKAEPIWVAAARQGLKVSVASATQVYPFAPFLEERRFGGNFGWNLVLFDGYQSLEGADQVYRAADLRPRPAGAWLGPLPAHNGEAREVELAVQDVRVDGLLYDDPADPVAGFDTLYLGLDRATSGGITLKPAALQAGSAEAFAPLRLRMAGGESSVFFRLHALAADGSDLLLYRTPVQQMRAHPSRLEGPALQAGGGFLGNGASWAYAEGRLGPTLGAGGDGTAERRYLESIALVARQFTRLTDFTFDKTEWDLLLAYLPYPDEALHTWLGVVDPAAHGHDAALAARLRPFVDEALRTVDAFIGHVAQRAAAAGAAIAISTDHGMQGVSRAVRPNVALAAAGLLALGPDGEVDLARTQAVYFRGNAGEVLVNRVGLPGGIVTADQEPEVRRKVAAALRAIKDPQTGKAVILDVMEPAPGQDPPLPPGALHISAAPTYDLSAALRGEVVGPITPQGAHRVDSRRPYMLGAFTMTGPGVASGVDLGLIRQVDVAPTLCTLLGIDPPAQAQGAVLEKALARPIR
ncbi:MAG TPA: alkaline phosphatase family protein [Vicinamibacteria bacterium]|nr:alkaline phosphatase family protein [Vicinamibacteria bacterium]